MRSPSCPKRCRRTSRRWSRRRAAATKAHVAAAAARLAAAAADAEAALDAREKRRFARFQSNALRRTRPYHSEPTHFHYPGLREREFHDREDFPWLGALEAATDAHRAPISSG